MWFVFVTAYFAAAAPGPAPDPAWVVQLVPELATCERRGSAALTTWACPDLNFAICHQDCGSAVNAIIGSTTNRYQSDGRVEAVLRRLPIEGRHARVHRTTWIQGRGTIAATLDVMHRSRDALVCGVSPMNPRGEYRCDSLLLRLAEQDLTAPPPPRKKVDKKKTEKTEKKKTDKTEKKKTEKPAYDDTVRKNYDPDTDALAPPKKLAAKKRVTTSETQLVRRRLGFAIQAYGAADYDRAGALALQVVSSPKATTRQRREALLMTGAIHRLEGRDAQARASFMHVLDADPNAKLPRVYPIQVRRYFEMVKMERRARPENMRPPTEKELGFAPMYSCKRSSNGPSRSLTCSTVQLTWRAHKSAEEAAALLRDEVMAYRAYTGIEIKKRYVECMIQDRASRCIDMTLTTSQGSQRSLLGYAMVQGRMLSVSCRWAGSSRREPRECRKLVSTR